jgi:imidazolonepropionase
MKQNHIIYHINELVTMRGPNRLRKGSEMNDVEIIRNGYLYIEDGLIKEIGEGDTFVASISNEVMMVDATGYTVVPGFIDSHTHLVHGGSRENEYAMKLVGVSYLDILKQGGGILSSVKATQLATKDQLYQKAKKSLNTMLLYGTTTVEAKSGYGLELVTEMKQLEVAHMLDANHPVDIIHTFMGAHAIPLKYKDNKKGYIKEIFYMLEVIKEKKLAKYCDVFCEEGVFSIDESKEILTYAKQLGFGIKIHADEITPLGGAALAAELGCVSADHLMATTVDDMKLLSKHNVVANLLPATSFYLDKDFAKARFMITNGCGIAISTDYNPGSTPCENIQLAMQIASIKMKLTPKEVLTSVTINAACSIEEQSRIGSFEIGKDADLLILDCPNLDYFIYHYGINHVKDVYKKGKLVVHNKQIVNEV